jgi:hypothetical protein
MNVRVGSDMQALLKDAVKENVNVFHNRLKFNVQKLTCHINRNRVDFERMLNGYNEDEAKTLARVLYLEIVNVIHAVEEAQ